MNAAPRIGELRHRLTLEAPVDTVDENGGFIRSFTPVAQIRGSIAAIAADEAFTEQRLEQRLRLMITIRWRGDVRSQMRFDHRGRKLLIKTVVDMDETERFLRCLCEEIS